MNKFLTLPLVVLALGACQMAASTAQVATPEVETTGAQVAQAQIQTGAGRQLSPNSSVKASSVRSGNLQRPRLLAGLERLRVWEWLCTICEASAGKSIFVSWKRRKDLPSIA